MLQCDIMMQVLDAMLEIGFLDNIVTSNIASLWTTGIGMLQMWTPGA